MIQSAFHTIQLTTKVAQSGFVAVRPGVGGAQLAINIAKSALDGLRLTVQTIRS